MRMHETTLELLSPSPKERQEKSRRCPLVSFCEDNPYKPLNPQKILSELAESRVCYDCGEGEDFDQVLDEIRTKYGL